MFIMALYENFVTDVECSYGLYSKNLSFLFRDYLWSILTTKPLFHSITVNGTHGYTFDIMVDEFLTVVIAGMETTANSMAMTFMELGRQPHIVRK